jgi:hypothetical protein
VFEIDYFKNERTKLLNICEELNELEFFTVARFDYTARDNLLLVLEFDFKTMIVNFNQGKVLQV